MTTTDTLGDFVFHDRVTKVLGSFSSFHLVDPKVLKAACERGETVHEIIEVLQEGFPVGIIDNSLQGYIDSYNLWALNKKFIDSTPRFYDDHLMITGKVDCIYKDHDGLVLVDFKTSAQESKTWKHQGSAYSYLCKRNGYDIRRIEFVKLDKTGKEPKVYPYQEKLDDFKLLLAIYREFFKTSKYDMGDL